MEEINLGKGSKILYKRKLVEENESKEMYKILLENEIEWEKREIKIYGKTFDQPRLISYMASDCELKYKYPQCSGRCIAMSDCSDHTQLFSGK